jgi:hypothetical protein
MLPGDLSFSLKMSTFSFYVLLVLLPMQLSAATLGKLHFLAKRDVNFECKDGMLTAIDCAGCPPRPTTEKERKKFIKKMKKALKNMLKSAKAISKANGTPGEELNQQAQKALELQKCAEAAKAGGDAPGLWY